VGLIKYSEKAYDCIQGLSRNIGVKKLIAKRQGRGSAIITVEHPIFR